MSARQVWKFVVEYPGSWACVMPAGAVVLSVQWQPNVGAPVLWALVEPRAPAAMRDFVTYGTGRPVDAAATQYRGTFQNPNSGEVWHVFEVPR